MLLCIFKATVSRAADPALAAVARAFRSEVHTQHASRGGSATATIQLPSTRHLCDVAESHFLCQLQWVLIFETPHRLLAEVLLAGAALVDDEEGIPTCVLELGSKCLCGNMMSKRNLVCRGYIR